MYKPGNRNIGVSFSLRVRCSTWLRSVTEDGIIDGYYVCKNRHSSEVMEKWVSAKCEPMWGNTNFAFVLEEGGIKMARLFTCHIVAHKVSPNSAPGPTRVSHRNKPLDYSPRRREPERDYISHDFYNCRMAKHINDRPDDDASSARGLRPPVPPKV